MTKKRLPPPLMAPPPPPLLGLGPVRPTAPPLDLYASVGPPAPPPYSRSDPARPVTAPSRMAPPPPAARVAEARKHSPPARFELKTPPVGRRFKSRKENPTLSMRRGCTDVCCALLFFVFLVAWAVVAGIAFMWGNPERLIHPTDSLGRTCGSVKKGAYDLSSKPFLVFFNLAKCASFSTVFTGCQTPQMCVEHCPEEYFSYLQMQVYFSNAQIVKDLPCLDSVNKASISSFAQLKQLVDQGQCAAYAVKSAPVLGRCIPQVVVGAVDGAVKANQSLDALKHQFGDDVKIPSDLMLNDSSKVIESMVNNDPWIVKIAADISVSWWAILSFILIAAVCAFLWTVVLRIFGSFMIWLSILAIMAAFGAGSAFSWWKWWTLTKAGAINDFSFQPMFQLYFEMPTTWMVLAIIASVFLLIVFLILLCVRSRIRVATGMIEESSKAIGSMLSTLVFPIFTFALRFIFFVMWATIAIWLASSGADNCRNLSAKSDANPCGISCDCRTLGKDPLCSYVNMTKDSTKVAWLQGYNLFALFWTQCFVTALGQIALAGAFASHYWAVDKNKDVPTFPVFRSLYIAFRYHIGSLAFGSLLIAITKFIRAILDWMDKKAQTTQNFVLHYILIALKCCFWCMEVFLKFLTKNAYIMMAIYGKNFFTSAKDSFGLLARNVVRAVVICNVTSFLLFLGKAVIAVGMGACSYYYFSGLWIIDGLPRIELYYYFVPIIITVLGSYFIASCFFDTYEMAVKTTFICFLEDSEQNDGSAAKPYFMSDNLKNILGVHNEGAKI
ncbi:hypothetical protein PMAYCL1PPCAC_01709 [Pristionchus mayeri]|uniref:Choline transporter-like protein n=1 Tax=Pristionchus mayeri TaxID=1317129 RepID=A0AAN4Z189_9BILA|nr:hypothetical protein PMAYCL1PPCAC_01709 [Pristionchus mayeri]